MPNIISAHSSNIIRKGKGIDPVLQENKAVNLKLASSKINGIIIRPGETFSFWKTVGKATRKKAINTIEALKFIEMPLKNQQKIS